MLSDADLRNLEQQLRSRGIATDGDLRWAAAVGAVQLMVRRSDGQVWEDWHCRPWGLADGEMMRANCAMTRLVHDRVDFAGTNWGGIAGALTDPDRALPDGRTLREYAGRRLPSLRRDVTHGAAIIVANESASGPRGALIGAASLTLMWGSDWYGMPAWPRTVEAFCAAVDDPAHPHWHGVTPPPRPASIADVAVLREQLFAGPDRLDADAAAWCIRAHLPYVAVPTGGASKS